MLIRSKNSFTAALIVGTMSGSLAKDAAVPTVDLQQFCKETASITMGTNSQSDLDACMHDQQDARDQLAKGWTTYPALAKERCVKPKEYRSSYVEWLTCLELTREVIRLRKEKSTSATAGTASGEECPIVKTDQDGNIVSVMAC